MSPSSSIQQADVSLRVVGADFRARQQLELQVAEAQKPVENLKSMSFRRNIGWMNAGFEEILQHQLIIVFNVDFHVVRRAMKMNEFGEAATRAT